MSAVVGLTLTFEAQSACLWKTEFSFETPGRPLRSVRARDASIFPGITGTFQWTAAVKAISELFLRYYLFGAGVLCEEKVLLRGGAGSPASSLDYALAKEPMWLTEMFGVASTGQAVARNLIKRINPERKRGGDVVLMINSRVLKPENISIQLSDGSKLDPAGAAGLLNRISADNPELQLKSPRENQPAAQIIKPAPAPKTRSLGVLSFIPIYTGDTTIDPDSKVWGLPSRKVNSGEFVPCRDGVGVLVSRTTFNVDDAADFLRQRRDRHIRILAGLTEHARDLQSFRPTNLRPALRHLGDLAFVMSAHSINEREAHFSEAELSCMAEPSILRISDGRSEFVGDSKADVSGQAHDISAVSTHGLRCFITWANIIVASSGAACVDLERVYRYELELQRTWYRIDFLDRLLRAGRTEDLGAGVFEKMLAAAQSEFSELSRPKALLGSHINLVTKAIFKASRIESLQAIMLGKIAALKAA